MAKIAIIEQFLSAEALAEVKRLEVSVTEINKQLTSAVGKLEKTLSANGGGTSKPKDYTYEVAQLKEIGKLEKQIIDLQAQLSNANTVEAVSVQSLRNARQEANRVRKLEIQLVNSAAGSYNALSAQYSLNKIELNKFSQATIEADARLMKLQGDTENLYNEMKRLQAATGNTSLNVGNYKSALTGVTKTTNSAYNSTFQMTQVMRELPNFAIDARIGFMSLSNNLPMLADGFKQLAATIDGTTGKAMGMGYAWKTMLKSLLSFNTVMIVGVTLMTLYGDKLIDWIGNLFKSNKTILETVNRVQTLTNAMRDGLKASVDERTQLMLNYKASQDTKLSIEQRTKAVEAMQKKYPNYLGNMSTEAILAGNAKGKYIDLTNAIIQNSIARAASEKISENSRESLDLLFKRTDAHEQLIAKEKDYIRFQKEEQAYRTELENQVADVGTFQSIKLGKLTDKTKDAKKAMDFWQASIDKANNTMKINNQENEVLVGMVQRAGYGLIDLGTQEEKSTEKTEKLSEAINYLAERSKGWQAVMKDSSKYSEDAANAYSELQTSIENIDYGDKLTAENDAYKLSYDALVKDKKSTEILTKNHNIALERIELEHTSTLEGINKDRNDTIGSIAYDNEKKDVKTHDAYLKSKADALKGFNSEYLALIQEGFKAEEDIRKDNADKLRKIYSAIFDTIFNIVDGFSEMYIRNLDEQSEKEQTISDNKVANIKLQYEAGLASKNDYDTAVNAAEAQQKARQEKDEEEKRKAQKTSFLFKQGLAIAEVWIEAFKQQAYYSTAAALAAATGNIVLAGLAAKGKAETYFLASAQTVAIAAQTIPYFADGGEVKQTGMIEVGDGQKRRGRKAHEVMVTPSGRAILTPDIPTYMQAEKGTVIYPNPQAYEQHVNNKTMLMNTMNTEAMEKEIRGLRSDLNRILPQKPLSLHERVKFLSDYGYKSN